MDLIVPYCLSVKSCLLLVSTVLLTNLQTKYKMFVMARHNDFTTLQNQKVDDEKWLVRCIVQESKRHPFPSHELNLYSKSMSQHI